MSSGVTTIFHPAPAVADYYWRHTYETWDRADNARRLELDFQTTRSGLEAARLGREIEASQQREREARLERERKERSIRLEESIETFRQQKEKALEVVGSYATTAEWANAQAEWRRELERIDPCRPEAKSALDGLLVKVRAFKSWFPQACRFGLTTPIPLLPDDPNTRILEPLDLAEIIETIGSIPTSIVPKPSFQSSLEEIEASLKPLVALWGAVQTRKRELAD